MGVQTQAFIEGEGRAWLERNRLKLMPEGDPVLDMIEVTGLKPQQVLEIGCANGWRLRAIIRRHGATCRGIDPAVDSDGIILNKGTADNLWRFTNGEFDLVIYGFCLYLCDPEDYFKIAMEGNRVLADGGFILIWDFYSPIAYKNPYSHKPGIFSHKMDFSKMWAWNPAYRLVNSSIVGEDDDCTAVFLLKKETNRAFPEQE